MNQPDKIAARLGPYAVPMPPVPTVNIKVAALREDVIRTATSESVEARRRRLADDPIVQLMESVGLTR